jgi:hypothetical protein
VAPHAAPPPRRRDDSDVSAYLRVEI